MFLKVSTALAILGLLAGIFLSIVREVISYSLYRSPGNLYLLRGLNVLFPFIVYVPLILFLIAFFLTLRSREH
jgi:hypothetical protein